jgi:CRISPR/Cas system-associated protein Cas7 (RAMP superfamily)
MQAYHMHYFVCFNDQIERNEMGGDRAGIGDRKDVYGVLVEKTDGKRPLGRPKRRSEYDITMDLQEVGCRGMDWIELVQDRDRCRALVNAVMNLLAP